MRMEVFHRKGKLRIDSYTQHLQHGWRKVWNKRFEFRNRTQKEVRKDSRLACTDVWMKFIEGRIIFLWYIAADRIDEPSEREKARENSDAMGERQWSGGIAFICGWRVRASRKQGKKAILRQYVDSARRMFISIRSYVSISFDNN